MTKCPKLVPLLGVATLLVTSLSSSPTLATASTLKAGVSVVDITPPIGWRMCGYFYERVSTDTHDPLLAKTLVFEQDRERYALVFCDLIGIEGGLATTARQRASKRAGVPIDHILICATHSHTGPLYSGSLRQHLHDTAVAKDGLDFRERVDYPDVLAERLADGIAQAVRHLEPITLETGRTEQRGLAFNRRFHMTDGSVVFNPGKTNAAIVRPAGPVDTSVGLVLLRNSKSSAPVASITTFALHCDTVGGTQFSADYPRYLELELQRRFGASFVSCFGNGPCGDINHINVSDPQPQKGHAEAARIGAILGNTVFTSVRALKPAKPSFASVTAKVFVPLQTNTVDEIAAARAKMPLVGTRKLKFLEEVDVCRVLDLALWNQTRRALEVQAFRLSDDTAIVGLPGEVFTDLGMAIKTGSPFKNTLVIELCNDNVAYVPTQKAFVEGSYEIVNSRVAPAGGEILVETAIRLLKEVKGRCIPYVAHLSAHAKANLPAHVAVIMDGNGRWAKQRHLPRVEGHREGAESVRAIVRAAGEAGIKYLTVYAFSVENWSRPKDEVDTLMKYLARYLKNEIGELTRNNVRLEAIGQIYRLPEFVQEQLARSKAALAKHNGLTLILALSYGGRTEIIEAVRDIAAKAQKGTIDPAEINEQTISQHLYTKNFPDPDLLIRTSGEMRVSNFLLWQISYSELVVTPTLWPDFRKAQLFEALEEYARRHRRFGVL